MSRPAERESVSIQGVLEGGGFFESRAIDGVTIYVGSDPRCEWRLEAPGVSPFHLQLCWFGNRLWMADLGGRLRAVPGAPAWTMAPIGVAVRLGGAKVVLRVATSSAGQTIHQGVPASTLRGWPDPAAVPYNAFAQPRGAGDVDPDATLLVDADELRAISPFGPPAPRAGDLPEAVAARPMAASPSAALEEMFIVPAEQPAPPPRKQGKFERLAMTVPVRNLIALIAAAGMAIVVFVPESLHANRDKPAPATLPARRPPPDPEIEVRAVQPVEVRAAAESVAARDLAAGRLEEALEDYRALQKEVPDDPVYRDFTAIIEQRMKARCKLGGCAEETP